MDFDGLGFCIHKYSFSFTNKEWFYHSAILIESMEETMKNDFKISVIIPVYNTEEYLSRCLDSVINNSYRNLEIICVNDGSTDGSLDILNEYKFRDKRIIVIDKENQGVSAARNTGMACATGDGIAFIDSDDWIHQNYFLILVQTLFDSKADMAVCERYTTAEFVQDKEIHYNHSIFRMITKNEFTLNHNCKYSVWGRVYKKKVLEHCRFVEGIKISEDKIFNMELLDKNPSIKIALVDEKMYYYFYRESSAMREANIDDQEIICWYYINKCKSMDNPSEVYVSEAVKSVLAYRYLAKYYPSKRNDNPKLTIKKLKRECYRIIKKSKRACIKYKCEYILLLTIPLIYFLFRRKVD